MRKKTKKKQSSAGKGRTRGKNDEMLLPKTNKPSAKPVFFELRLNYVLFHRALSKNIKKLGNIEFCGLTVIQGADSIEQVAHESDHNKTVANQKEETK